MINPSLGWKENKLKAPPQGFDVGGGAPSHGTFAEQVIVPAENVVEPDI